MTKMHPKPMERHTRSPEDVELSVSWNDMHPSPVHVLFTFGKATQRLILTETEARALYEELATVLRFRDTPAADINMSEWSRFFSAIRGPIKGA